MSGYGLIGSAKDAQVLCERSPRRCCSIRTAANGYIVSIDEYPSSENVFTDSKDAMAFVLCHLTGVGQ